MGQIRRKRIYVSIAFALLFSFCEGNHAIDLVGDFSKNEAKDPQLLGTWFDTTIKPLSNGYVFYSGVLYSKSGYYSESQTSSMGYFRVSNSASEYDSILNKTVINGDWYTRNDTLFTKTVTMRTSQPIQDGSLGTQTFSSVVTDTGQSKYEFHGADTLLIEIPGNTEIIGEGGNQNDTIRYYEWFVRK